MSSHDPTSSAYKRALRRHVKTLEEKKGIVNAWSAFRTEEKRFKARFPRPELRDVLDLSTLDDGAQSDPVLVSAGWTCAPCDVTRVVPLPLRVSVPGSAFLVPEIPGVF